MVQYRQNMTGRARKVKRVSQNDQQLKWDEIKGVSGLKSDAHVSMGGPKVQTTDRNSKDDEDEITSRMRNSRI